MLSTLKRVVADDRITFTPLKPAKPSPPSPLTPELFYAIEQAKSKLWPDSPIVPGMETGATDSLYFRQKKAPTYGITGTATDLDDVREHGKDERMAVQGFYDGLEFEYQSGQSDLVQASLRGIRKPAYLIRGSAPAARGLSGFHFPALLHRFGQQTQNPNRSPQ